MLIPKTRKEIYQAYLSGDTDLELPKPVTRDEIILYNACINGAGTNPSWNDLTDKPFGAELAFSPLVWEGDVENPNYIPEAKMCKVSDTPLSIEALVGSEITVECVIQTDSGSVRQTTKAYISPEDVSDNGSMITVSMGVKELEFGEVRIYSLPDVVNGLGPGVFFEKKEEGNVYCQPVRLVKENITTIDPKYIVLTSPNGTKYNLSVSDSGTLTATAAT